jgi:coenzyme F420 biosynthesis associated uncharacterized protein
MVDWFLAEKLATWVAGSSDGRPRGDLEAMSRDAEERVVAYTRLDPVRTVPPPEGVSRAEWVKANLSGMQVLLDPVLAKAGTGSGPLKPAMRIAAGIAMTAEVGVLIGFMAQRVLGQYELVLLEPAETRAPRLLFVLPNLLETVRTLDVPEEEFVRWVALHEVTHAVQFAGVPWLQEYLGEQVKTLLAAAEVRIEASRGLKFPSADAIKEAIGHLRRGDVISLVTQPEERETLDRVQAAMAVVEGHAEHVMDAVGQDVLPSLPQLRDALEVRRRSASGAGRLLQKLLGLEMKMRQYKMGKAFCDAVVADGGIERLNDVWRGPEMLPSADELEHPEQWLRRTRPPQLESA